MANKTEKITSSLLSILKGMKDVARVTITKKPVQTDFTPQTPKTPNPDDELTADSDSHTQKISSDNELGLTPDSLDNMVDFITTHSSLDMCAVPCSFNGQLAQVVLCAFPRLVKPIDDPPFVRDVITLTVRNEDGGVLATAAYDTNKANVVREFQGDMEALSKPSEQSAPSYPFYDEDELRSYYPGFTVPHSPIFPNTPIFVGEESSESPKGELE